MKKESLSLYIFERLQGELEGWTDPAYADSLTIEEAKKQILDNLEEEVQAAKIEFTL